MRLFIAVPLPLTLREHLQLQSERCFDTDMLRLVRGEGLHITLLFLGEQDPAYAERVEEIFGRLKNTLSRFTISFSGIITFPQRRAPRVVAAPVIEGTKELRNMHHELAELLDGDKRKNYTPHITLGRVRKHVHDGRRNRDRNSRTRDSGSGNGRDSGGIYLLQDICRSEIPGSRQNGNSRAAISNDLFTGSFTADRIVLYASILDPAGALYRELASCQLS